MASAGRNNDGDGPQGFDLPAWAIGWYTVVVIGAIVTSLVGFQNDDKVLYIEGLASLGGLALILPVAVLIYQMASATNNREIAKAMKDLAKALERSSDELALSDDARRVLNRKHERDMLCKAIEEDILAEDWDAAMILVKELAERFGYRIEAEDFRARIDRARATTIDRRVTEAVRNLDAMIVRLDWDNALAEAERIARVFPESSRVEGLRNKVTRSRTRYKEELERRFLHAAEAERVDEAVELLKELDSYLTEAEAEPYQELARGVIGKARENLGVQFKLYVQDKNWRDAAVVGERIIGEFPNTRMAEEVRGMIDTIRDRASAMPL
ncbi:MAG: hypothetical protein AAGI17_02365 [Planctomycetota bacterium]